MGHYDPPRWSSEDVLLARELRRLAAIVAIDVVGYSRLMGRNESATHALFKTHLAERVEPAITRHGGRLVKSTGDGALAEFGSAVDALSAAIELQQGMADANRGQSEEERIVFRAGVHLGDIIVEAHDVYGDAVNIAARLEAEAPPGGIVVSRAVREAVQDRLKASLHALGELDLKNISRRMRAFRVEWKAEDWPASKAVVSPVSSARPIAGSTAPPRLSIVVLPFSNIGGDPEHEYFVDGVTESLTTDLSRVGGTLVIARNTAFTYKGKSVDVMQVGRELNTRYALEGSVQRSGSRMRVNVQLIDTATGGHLWAERFDKPLGDLFDMQDEVVARLARQLGTQLIGAEARRAERAPNPDSLDLYFQGIALLNKGNTPDYLVQARGYLERALKLDPGNIEALVWGAYVDALKASLYAADDRAAQLAAAEAALGTALSLAPDHAGAHLFLGLVQIQTNRAVQGIASCERALALDRNLAPAHAMIGLAKYRIGRSEETEAHIEEALRLSPRDTFGAAWLSISGDAKLFLGSDEEAVERLRGALALNRNNPYTNFLLGAALAHLGRLEEAKAAVQAGLTLNREFTLRRYRAGAASDNPTFLAQRERVVAGLRMAGVPEE
jgi:TolB-like protein/class 3 adenylate cyclase/Flp pilus assembly protein TadD